MNIRPRWLVSRLAALWATVLCLWAAPGSWAQEIGFIEQFALADDRAGVLDQLVPGTEAYYYFHCLHYQNTQQFDKVEQLLPAWINRLGQTQLVTEIQNRQALLTYEQNPQATLEYLRRVMGLRLDHQREIPEAERDLPHRLDPAQISYQTLAARALRQHANTDGFETAGLESLVRQQLDHVQLRSLLERLPRPDIDGLAELVVRDLAERDSGGFGSLQIHHQLTLQQLDQCARLAPRLLAETNFVNIYLPKLRPGDDVNWRIDLQAQEDYLDRLWNFARQLDPVFNSLKAHILYHRLDLDRHRGEYNKQRFVEYLRLPRQVAYVNPKLIEQLGSPQHLVDINAGSPVAMLAAIGNDEPLVNDFLRHLLLEATDYSEYLPYVLDDYLKQQFAEVKITHGLGDNEQWASMLSPQQFQQLMERVDLEFALTNPLRFAVEDAVQLEVYTKNIDRLIVKIFQLNAENYYRQNGREIDTDIPLDGLIPNWEQTFDYDDPPLRRVRRSFSFPQIEGEGVFVIDFIGNGISSRALVRKGHLQHFVETTVAGQRFTIFDAAQQPVKDATLWIAGHHYQPEDDGSILIPFSTQPGRQAVIVNRGSFSSLGSFDHLAENYQLVAGMYVDRESLLRSKKATVVIRPALVLQDTPVPLSLLSDVRLSIRSTDLDGISATMEVKDFQLASDQETHHEFQVPPRLRSIEFTLSGKVENISQRTDQPLSATQSFAVNQIDQTVAIRDVHLVCSESESFRLEVRDKNGQPRARQAVLLSLKHRMFTEPATVSLQTDELGSIDLGALQQISEFSATLSDGQQKSWVVPRAEQTVYPAVHAAEGEPIRIPYPDGQASASRKLLSLFETRESLIVADHFDALQLQQGLITITALPPGDYRLVLKDYDQTIAIRVARGVMHAGYAMGAKRSLKLSAANPLHIKSVTAEADQVSIELGGTGSASRVHVFATRQVPRFDAFALLSQVRGSQPMLINHAVLQSAYVQGRDIGDEYRYILNRKYTPKFPGNMLPRPSLLLNPWAVRTTENQADTLAGGGAFDAFGGQTDSEVHKEAEQRSNGAALDDFGNLDFLADSTVVLLNLRPDQTGRVTIDRGLLGDKQDLHIVVDDARSTATRFVRLPLRQAELRDLRLASGLDPNQQFSQSKQHAVLEPGEPLTLADVSSSKFQYYDDLGDVYRLFVTLSGDQRLGLFRFILQWPHKTLEEKQELYSRQACHELSFFLQQKDPEFFKAVVRPYLANKRDKTYLDHWLLESDLNGYLRSWEYQRLNAAERIALGQRLPNDRPAITQNILDMYQLTPTGRQAFDRLFDVAIKNDVLDATAGFAFAGAYKSVDDLKSAQRNLNTRGVDAANGDVFFSRPQAGVALQRDGAPLPDPAAPPPVTTTGRLPISEGDLAAVAEHTSDGERDSQLAQQPADKSLETLAAAEDELELQEGTVLRRLMERRNSIEQLYRQIQATEEWVENNYYHLPIGEQTPELIRVNRFWRDYAQTDGPSFLSPYFPEATGSFAEMMLALAVLDLPFEGPEHKFDFAENSMTLQPAGKLVAFYQEVQSAVFDRGESKILVSENFFRNDDRYRYEGEQRYDKFVSGEFLAHVLYGGQVVVTNPTSTPQPVDVLVQVPQGAMPANNSQPTRTMQLDLEAFSTKTLEYYFYFPEAGQFTHYPAHVSLEQRVVAVADPIAFDVLDRPTQVDRQSWAYVSQNGSDQEVLEFLQNQNVLRLDLAKIAFRMKDPSFFRKAINVLSSRLGYDPTLWSYAVAHNDLEALREFLRHAESFLGQCGAYLDCSLVRIDPVQRRWYEHREYWPLVNARAHQLGPQRKILNPALWEQYHRLLRILAARRQLDSYDHLGVASYLLLQDRVDDALKHFEQVDPEALASRLQYDYCAAYLAMSRGQPEQASQIAQVHVQHPVQRWRNLFAEVLQQVKQIESAEVSAVDPKSDQQQHTQLAAQSPSLDFSVEARQVKVHYQNIRRLTVNYYEMDLELLFSRDPFVKQDSGNFAMIRPNSTQVVELPEGQTSFNFELPAELHTSNVLVEIVAGDQTRSQAYFAHRMNVQLAENYGQLAVSSEDEDRPLAKVYVKVYSRNQDGSVKFYKDGYTDLRGWFDYASLSNQPLDDVERFSILILSDDHGAMVREAAPPKS